MAANNGQLYADEDTDADESASESAAPPAPAARPTNRNQRRVFGVGSPGGVYGPLRDTYELEQALAGCAQYQDVRVHVTHVHPSGAQTVVPVCTLSAFDWEQMSQARGPGEYRIRVQAAGQPKAVAMLRLQVAEPQRPMWATPPAPQLAALPPAVAPAPPVTSSDLIGFMVATMKQQSDLMMTLLTNKQEPKSPAIAELAALIKLTREMGGGEGETGDGGMLRDLIRGFGEMAKAAPRHGMRAVKAAATKHVAGAARQIAAATATAGSPPMASPPPGGQSGNLTHAVPTAQPAEVDRMAAFVAMVCKSNPETRQASNYAAILDDNLSEGERDLLLDLPQGQPTSHLIGQYPQLSAHAEFVAAIESELRQLYADDGDAGDEGQEGRTDAPQ